MAACTTFTRSVLKVSYPSSLSPSPMPTSHTYAVQHFIANRGHDAQTIPALKIVSAHPTKGVKASMQIEQRNVNRLSSVHGGLLATLIDTGGSLALSSKGMWLTGVRRHTFSAFCTKAADMYART